MTRCERDVPAARDMPTVRPVDDKIDRSVDCRISRCTPDKEISSDVSTRT